MERIERSEKIDLESLSRQLESAGIDLSEWGIGEAKTVEHLFQEIEAGEAVLVTGDDGGLMRQISVAAADILYVSPDGTKYRLRESRQVFQDGRERVRNLEQSLSEKIKPSEEPRAALVRGIQEELGIVGGVGIGQVGAAETVHASSSYPGLESRYDCHEFIVALNDRQFNSEGYVEKQDDITTYFVWEEVK